jgi:hypothetical protein
MLTWRLRGGGQRFELVAKNMRVVAGCLKRQSFIFRQATVRQDQAQLGQIVTGRIFAQGVDYRGCGGLEGFLGSVITFFGHGFSLSWLKIIECVRFLGLFFLFARCRCQL